MDPIKSLNHRKSWNRQVGFVLWLEAAWFVLLYPLVPATATGFFLEFGCGLMVMGALLGAHQIRKRWAHRTLVLGILIVVVVLLVMGAIVSLGQLFKYSFATDFSAGGHRAVVMCLFLVAVLWRFGHFFEQPADSPLRREGDRL
jgi:hypothetical protein